MGEYDTAFDSLRHINEFMTLQGYYDLQVEYYLDLVKVYDEIGDKSNWKYTASLTSLGNAYHSLGQYQQAIQYHQQSLAIDIETGDRNGEATSYIGLGSAYLSLGQYQQAIQYHQQSLAIFTEIGDLAEGEIRKAARNGEATSYIGLGSAYLSLGQYQQAIQYYQQSLAIFTEIGDLAEGEIRKAARKGEANSYGNLGSAYYSLGQYQQAIQYYQSALQLFQQLGNPHNVIICLDNLGETYRVLKQYPQAIECYQAILEIKRNLQDKEGEARTLIILGGIYQQSGKIKEGFALSYQGNQILQELGLPLSEMPYPQWLKSCIQFAQQGKLQLILCFVVGVVAFPFALVGFIVLLLWRWVRSKVR